MKRRSSVAATIAVCLALLAAGGCRTESGNPRDPGKGGLAAGGPDNVVTPSTTPGEAASPLPPGLSVPAGYPYKGKVIFAVGKRPVTEEELRRFSRRMLGAAEHAKNPTFHPEKVVKSFARYWAIVEKGTALGVSETPKVRNVIDVYRYSGLANDYRARLDQSVPVPDDAIRASIPSDWTRMEFSVVTFPDPKEADRFHGEVIGRKKSMSKEDFTKFAAEAFKSRTGKIFRGSGFFVAAEEPYLFGLKEGEVSRPIDTGIGRGVCYVVEREFLDGKVREEYIEQARARVREQEIGARFKAIVGKARYTVHRDNASQAVQMEGRTGLQADLTVLTLQEPGGGITLTYRDFRNLSASNYVVYFRTLPAESWVNFVLPEVENIAHLYAVGHEAARQQPSLDPKWDTEMFDFRGKTIYNATIDRLLMETTPPVTDAEVERYYKSNRGFFDRKETLRIRYVYAPEREALESLARQAGSRENIFAKKEYAGLVKDRIVAQGEQTFGELFHALDGVNAGKISGVVKADMGYYIAKVEERRPKGFLPLKEVRDRIRGTLLNEKRQDKARETIDAWMASVQVRKL